MGIKQLIKKHMLNIKLFLIFAIFTVLLSGVFSIGGFTIYLITTIIQYNEAQETVAEYVAEQIAFSYPKLFKNPERVSKKSLREISNVLNLLNYTTGEGAISIYYLDEAGNEVLLVETDYDYMGDGTRFRNENIQGQLIPFNDDDDDDEQDLCYLHQSQKEIIVDGKVMGYCYVENIVKVVDDFFIVITSFLLVSLAVVAVFALIMSFITSLMIVHPIGILTDQVIKFGADSDKNAFAKRINTHDEIQILQDAFIDMAEHLTEATGIKIAEAAEKERELTLYKVYKEMKDALLPGDAVLSPSEFVDMNWINLGTTSLESDCCNYYKRNDGKIIFFVASLEETGIMSAMFMMIATAIIKSYVRSERDFEKCVTEINRQIFINLSKEHAVNVFFGMIDEENSMLYTINCGGRPALFADSKRNLSRMPGRIYDSLGFSENVNYRAESMKISEGDVIYVSNGKFEKNHNKDGEEYDFSRFAAIVENFSNRSTDAGEILEKAEMDFISFLKGTKLQREILMIAISYKKPDKKRAEKTVPPNMNYVGQLQDFVGLQLKQNEIPPKANAFMRVIVEELFHVFCVNTFGNEIRTLCDIDENKYLRIEMSSRVKGGKDVFDDSKDEAVSFVKRNTDRFELAEEGDNIKVIIEKQM